MARSGHTAGAGQGSRTGRNGRKVPRPRTATRRRQRSAGAFVGPLGEGHSRVLELIAAGVPLGETLDSLMRLIEAGMQGVLGSILLLDEDGVHLRHGAAPSLPPQFSRAIDGAAIGPRAGSCGTAAYRNESVIVEDIERDPLWADYRALAAPHGLRACWSTPIRDVGGRVLGTFALYMRKPGRPSAGQLRAIEQVTHTASIAIAKAKGERERARVQAALGESEAVFRSIFENAAIGITMANMREEIVRCNPAFARLLGYTAAEIAGRTFSEFTHPDDIAANQTLFGSLRNGEIESFQLQKRYLRKDGRAIWVQLTVSAVRQAGGGARFTMGMVEDITARKEAEERVRHLAYHDALTDLPNRVALEARLAEAVGEAKSRRGSLALLLMNLHNFRDINDTLGHVNGDALLRQVAGKLREALWQSDLVASLGGDEYAILLARLASRDDIDLVLGKITVALDRPFTVAGIPVSVEASLGIALYPEHGDNPELLWQHADVALRAAREKHVSPLFYARDLDHYDPRKLALLGELAGAITRDELVLHYQPKIDLATEATVGVEALVRWQHPVHGLIFPDQFVPLAERTQLINPLTTWVLAHALRQGRAWHESGQVLELSVNLSARNLHNPHLGGEILALARSLRFPLERLTLEVTESAIMADPALAKAVLAELEQAGIRLSIDDFGIGQSSFAYLKDLPVSRMKIDKSFVMGFGEPRNAAIVRSAIELAHNLGFQVTAEGVEDEKACRELRQLTCDLAQGYYFARPMPAEQFAAWLKDSRWKVAPKNSFPP
jgi:diguanylate cyclase (GGDEF)-like protein/PAS domain S-box-containing protein